MRPSQHTNNPVVLSSLKIWKQFRHHFGLKSLSVLIPICKNHLFLPATIDKTFMLWRNLGLVSFSDLYLDKTFGSFADLVIKFGLSKQSLFRYFQLRHFTKAHFTSFPVLPAKTLFHPLPVMYNSISSIDDLLLSSQVSPLLGLKDTREKELGLTLDKIWWREALIRIHTVPLAFVRE